jgi:hypothetical protein
LKEQTQPVIAATKGVNIQVSRSVEMVKKLQRPTMGTKQKTASINEPPIISYYENKF